MGKRLFLSGALSLLVLPIVTLAVPGPGAALAATASPSPSPSQSPCLTPDEFSMNVSPSSPSSASSGDPVSVSASYMTELCRNQPQPARTVTLYARYPDGTQAVVDSGQSDSKGSITFVEHPTITSIYSVKFDNQGPFSHDGYNKVTITRTTGSCAGAVSLAAPAALRVGTLVPVTGSTSETGTVTIAFRKRGQSAFQIRRTLTPKPDGTFSTSFLAIDDYRLYASTSRCDSPPLLVQAQPVMSGPATVRRGSPVTLLVRAPQGVPVKVYFHRAGTSGYTARRTGSTDSSGRYATTYLADADYRYYAITGPGTRSSNNGLTQVQR